MTTQPRERDGQRARERPVVAERHRRRERARRAPRRPTCRRDRERGRRDLTGGKEARLRGGVAPEWVERRTSTKLEPGVTSSEAARIRDRESEPGAPPSERDPDVEPRRSSWPERPPATSLAPFRAPGAPPSPSAARSGDPHTDFEAASRHPSARGAGTQSSPPSWSPSRRRTSQVGDPHAHVVAATKAGHDVGRDQVARLMAMSGIWGDERHRGVTTTKRRPSCCNDVIEQLFPEGAQGCDEGLLALLGQHWRTLPTDGHPEVPLEHGAGQLPALGVGRHEINLLDPALVLQPGRVRGRGARLEKRPHGARLP